MAINRSRKHKTAELLFFTAFILTWSVAQILGRPGGS